MPLAAILRSASATPHYGQPHSAFITPPIFSHIVTPLRHCHYYATLLLTTVDTLICHMPYADIVDTHYASAINSLLDFRRHAFYYASYALIRYVTLHIRQPY